MSIDSPTGEPPGSDRPVRQYFPCFDVDHRDLVLVLQIDVDLAGAVGGKKLGFTAQVDGRINGSGLRIDIGLERHQHSVVARDDQYKAAGFVVNDAVRIGVRA